MDTYNDETYDSDIQPDYRGWHFYQDSLRPRSWSYILWLLFALVLATAVFKVFAGSPRGSILPSVFVYYTIIGMHLFHRLSRDTKQNILAPDLLFIFVYTLFHLGYVTLHAIGVVPYFEEVFVFESSIPKALFIVNLGLISFLAGYEFLGTRRNTEQYAGSICRPTEMWCLFGLGILILALLMHVGIIGFMGMRLLDFSF